MTDDKGYFHVILEDYGCEKTMHVLADVYFHDGHYSWTADEPAGCEIPLEEAIEYGIDDCTEWIERKSYQYDDIDLSEGYDLDLLDCPKIPIQDMAKLRDLPSGEYALVYKM